ncbi:aminotransferase class IV [Aquamicrobium terrae]|uniref:Probable branched-chain-amino-acid aminotransferase n=1 Tax=Aquamicrobium terrae TaxID=1324945 RepID=A0ABV2N0C6_9HYPH
MSDLIGYCDGELKPMSAAKIHVLDRGFRFGDAVFDSARTVRHRVYKSREHLIRLMHSATATHIEIAETLDELDTICQQVAEANSHILAENDEIWITPIVTRGPLNRDAPFSNGPATLVVAAERLNFSRYAENYRTGASLLTPAVRAIPAQCIDSRIKAISRLQYGLAEAEVKKLDTSAAPLMLDLDGNATETTGANFFCVRHGELMTAPDRDVLNGISRATVFDLAQKLQIPVRRCKLPLFDVLAADEAFTTGTSFCMQPVTRINGQKIGSGAPGQITLSLLDAWSAEIGLDIAAQALSHVRA